MKKIYLLAVILVLISLIPLTWKNIDGTYVSKTMYGHNVETILVLKDGKITEIYNGRSGIAGSYTDEKAVLWGDKEHKIDYRYPYIWDTDSCPPLV